MACKCGSVRVVRITAKCGDMFSAKSGLKEYNGYVPREFNIGAGDYINFILCIDCGRIQGGIWPVSQNVLDDIFEET